MSNDTEEIPVIPAKAGLRSPGAIANGVAGAEGASHRMWRVIQRLYRQSRWVPAPRLRGTTGVVTQFRKPQ